MGYVDDDSPPLVLVVDDEPAVAEFVSHFLDSIGYGAICANRGEIALEMAKNYLPDAILLDLRMPGMSGFEVCRRIKADPVTSYLPVIVVTGLQDTQSNIEAIKAGADDYISKPFDQVLLHARLRNAIHAKRMHEELIIHRDLLEQKVLERTEQLLRTQRITIFSLAKLAESRDTETGEHLSRMQEYVKILIEWLMGKGVYKDCLDPTVADNIYYSSPLHDVGKVGIPDQVLLKPGKLTPEEFDIMKMHTLIGGATIEAADREAGGNSFLTIGKDIAYYHHEKWDGSGYPYGLTGYEIPLCARIVALADVYDALSSKRPYKTAWPHEKVREEILRGRGKHFDPVLVDAFLDEEEKFVAVRQRLPDTGAVSPLYEMVQKLGATHPLQEALVV